MIILDHNIIKEQAELLKRQRIHFQRIGVEIGLPSSLSERKITHLKNQ